ncbi:MAG: DEAD/DEAH box helicase [Proteobacteria bacterium]|nr:DEAD/DEAH box helicase [Pseudomonadota bacterium]MCP4918053.1 DEAD/DEAH box helicase [Pseudomonadota bacterium]
MSFADLKLLDSLVGTLTEQKLTEPTEIQARTIPDLLEGRSLVGVSETGSGKTLAFALPMLHQLKSLELNGSPVEQTGRPRGLVVVPARELGEQVGRVFKGLTHTTRLRVRTVLGGTKKQIARQNVGGRFEILVATPGRLMQLLAAKALRLDDVRMLVFDEADQVLDPGFRKTATLIAAACPKNVQLVMFSATLPPALQPTVDSVFASPPIHVRTDGSRRLVPTLRTRNMQVTDGRRFDVLRDLFDQDATTPTLLFANTREQCGRVSKWLETLDIQHVVYRGEMDRVERRANLARFRNGEVPALLATDLGGRGLDIERVDRVVNVHLPQDLDNYLHRAGRTARAGRSGLLVNLITERDELLMRKVEKLG